MVATAAAAGAESTMLSETETNALSPFHVVVVYHFTYIAWGHWWLKKFFTYGISLSSTPCREVSLDTIYYRLLR